MENKTIIMNFRVNREEQDLILKASYLENRTLASYMRNCVLKKAKKDLDADY